MRTARSAKGVLLEASIDARGDAASASPFDNNDYRRSTTVRFLNHAGRLTLLDVGGAGIDVASESGGVLPASPPEALERWDEVIDWARANGGDGGEVRIDEAQIGAPSPRPRQTMGVGLNYASHAAEAGFEPPEYPLIFPKLAAASAGPFDEIAIFTETVDWEVELAVVIGRRARLVAAHDAWDHVAGLTIGQDLSDREIQMRPEGNAQFSLGKSLPGFGPTGPQLVTIDEFDDPNDLELSCSLNGEEVQHGRTSDFIFSIPQIIEYLAAITELYPGDVIMTGTPSGVGYARNPPRYLKVGDVLESRIEGIGLMRHRIVAETPAETPVVSAVQV